MSFAEVPELDDLNCFSSNTTLLVWRKVRSPFDLIVLPVQELRLWQVARGEHRPAMRNNNGLLLVGFTQVI